MNSTLRTLVSEYGTATIIARVLEQLKLAALSDDEEVRAAVRELLETAARDEAHLGVVEQAGEGRRHRRVHRRLRRGERVIEVEDDRRQVGGPTKTHAPRLRGARPATLAGR